MSFASASLLAAWVMIALLALAMAGLYSRVRVLEPGSVAFADQLVGSYAPAMGNGRALSDALVLFLSDRCNVCQALLAEVAEGQRDGELPVRSVVSVFSVRDAGGLPSWSIAEGVETHADPVFVERFHITATPTVVYIDKDGLVKHLSPISSPERFRAELQSLWPAAETGEPTLPIGEGP